MITPDSAIRSGVNFRSDISGRNSLTNQYNIAYKFLKPEELEVKFSKLKLHYKDSKGLVFNPFLKKWKKSKDMNVNYIMVFTKN